MRLRLKADIVEVERYEAARGNVERWVCALEARGYQVSLEDVYAAWRRHSEASSAGWLAPYGDEERDCAALLTELEPNDD